MLPLEAKEAPFAKSVVGVAHEILGLEFTWENLSADYRIIYLPSLKDSIRYVNSRRDYLTDPLSAQSVVIEQFRTRTRRPIPAEETARTVAAAIIFDKDIFQGYYPELELRYLLDEALRLSVLDFQSLFSRADIVASYEDNPEEQVVAQEAANHESRLIDTYKSFQDKLRERVPESTGVERK